MGRPEPCILFAQSFVHTQLDEYADEVIFAEPVVVTACEFLEQNASPSSPNISLIGATSPPSFALEVFVHCEGESRFRRLCQPFLYSHSSSNVLEVEAVVTNHLLLRGKYRSLSLVVYGNTAVDLGQYDVDFDADNSLANVVYSSSDGKLEDLPPALWSTKLTFEESMSSFGSLGFPFPENDITPDMKQFLQLALAISKVTNEPSTVSKLVTTVVSAVSSYANHNNSSVPLYWDRHMLSVNNKRDPQQVNRVISEARNELFEIYKYLQLSSGSSQPLEDEIVLGAEADLPTSEALVDMFSNSFHSFVKVADEELYLLLQNKDMIIGLGLALLMCSSQESCYWFVSGGAMEQIVKFLCHEIKKSTSTTLLLLGIVECATRIGIGCEGYLGWWPREHDNVPIRRSDGYCYLLELLLGNQRHDVASLATYILHRLRLYEIASRYECAVLSGLTNLEADSHNMTNGIEFLHAVNDLLKQITRLLTSFGPIEDPSSMASARNLLIPGQSEDLLSYRTTFNIIDTSKCNFVKKEIDPYLLSLLKEKGFFPLSTALLASPLLRSASGSTMDAFADIVLSIQSILLSLVSCRSGLSFLLAQPEVTALMILSLQDVEDMGKAECMTLRQASAFLLKGFFCRPQDVGTITELQCRVGTAISRLLRTPCNSDELLWVLWELCAISRSSCGREAVLAFGHFPEAIHALLDALCSFKDVESVAANSDPAGTSPLSLAIFHSAAEIFEVIVTDSTAASLGSWIEHAGELHKALHSFSPGSNRKDAPTRLLEWIDAGVIYHRNGAAGVLRYAAVLASGGDAHLSSTNVLVSDTLDAENVVGDSTTAADTHVVDSLLGKLVSEKNFEGIALRNTSIVQLTTSFRILAILSENSAVAASLFDEGAVTVIYVVLVNCKYMLERLSNSFDYLVDEGAECNSTSDLLLERSHEQSLLDLMIPSLVLLINLLRKLQNAKELYRNKKLLNSLLKLHREVSPKLAACAADLSFPYPTSALGFGTVCHLLASALAFWPVFSWLPGLFHCVLESVQADSLLALGPKDACSMLCLLGDLFPEEDIFLWKSEMPSLSALRTLSIGTILGPQMESDVNWYLQPEHLAVLLVRLTPHLDKIAEIVLHFAFTSLLVIQDMLRIFVTRVACQRVPCAVVLLRPIISWMGSLVTETLPSDSSIFKMHRLLHFIASLLEHPQNNTLLLKVGALRVLESVLQRCSDASQADEKQNSENRPPSQSVTILCWTYPVFKCLTSIFGSETSSDVYEGDKFSEEIMSYKDYTVFGSHILKLCQVLPVGRELLACVITFKELISSSQGRSAIVSFYSQIQPSGFEEQESDERHTDPNNSDLKRSPPFLGCLKKLLRSFDSMSTASIFIIETIYALSLSVIRLSMEGKDLKGVAVLKFFFGLKDDPDGAEVSSDENLKDVHDLIQKLEQKIIEEEMIASSSRKSKLHQVSESVKSMYYLLQHQFDSSDMLDGITVSEDCKSVSNLVRSMIMTSQLMPRGLVSTDDAVMPFFANLWKLNQEADDSSNDYFFGVYAEKFVWECPDSSPDRQLTVNRNLLADISKRTRDLPGTETNTLNTFHRANSLPSIPPVPNRRDTFRQRKPNTSRPPSVHVDDYVARERNVDGVSSGSNIINPRGGSSGRPPSTHVDVFMARERRQNTVSLPVGEASQLMNLDNVNLNDPVKLDGTQQLKADLDDDLQEINIIFDEESESDDRMPFPQADDNLQSAPVRTGEISPGSVVEETDDNTNGSSRLPLNTPAAYEDEGSRSDIPLKRSTIQSDIPMTRELKGPAEKKFPASASLDKASLCEHSDESKYSSPVVGSRGTDAVTLTNPRNYNTPSFNMFSSSSVETVPPPRMYHRNSPQQSDTPLAVRSHRYAEKRPVNQPPLPPTPPPTLSSLPVDEPIQRKSATYGHSTRDVQPPLPSGYRPQKFDVNGDHNIVGVPVPTEQVTSVNHSPIVSMANFQTGMDSRYVWSTPTSGNRLQVEPFAPNTSARPMPPLPPHPPPFSTTNIGPQQPPPSTPMSDTGLVYISTSGNNTSPYAPAQFPMLVSRTTSASGTIYSSPPQHLGHPTSATWPSVQSVQPRPPPPPLPHLPHHLPQHLGTPTQVSQPPEQGIPLQQNPVQFQVQPLQVPQQLHTSQLQFFYPQPQEPVVQSTQVLVDQSRTQNLNQLADSTLNQQIDSGIALQEYFSSPEAIQSLLGDRDKLCQLLEQHPKLMQMLQDKLGQR